MANTRSAIKRTRQNPKRHLRNRFYITRTRTFIKKARTALGAGKIELARTATAEAVSVLDKAAEKGIIHRNNAARRKSRLMSQLAKLEKQAN